MGRNIGRGPAIASSRVTHSETATMPALLVADDPVPVEIINPRGKSKLLLICEHAGRAIPTVLGNMGVSKSDFERHIVYDIGAEALARQMSDVLDASLLIQPYSRLVIDCNRPLRAFDCIPTSSDGTSIPANLVLDGAAKQQRFDEIHRPFHNAISDLLDQRAEAGKPSVLVSVHSFTPKLVLSKRQRPWHLGLLYLQDDILARKVMEIFRTLAPDMSVALNQPYLVDEDSDYTIPVHAVQRHLRHVLLEVRNDQLQNTVQQSYWGRLLARALNVSLSDDELGP